MDSDNLFALFITWTTYGSWLPGDERGYVSDTFHADGSVEGKHNIPGTPYTADSPLTRARARHKQKEPTVYLTSGQAPAAAQPLVHAAGERGWRINEGAVMRSHAHVLVFDTPDDGPGVRRILKGVSQAALSRAVGEPRKWWTSGGSNRYLHHEDAILNVKRYIAEQYGKLVEIRDNRVKAVE